MSEDGRTRLILVGPGDALSGVAPARFERAAKTCQAGDRVHRGLLRIAASVARHGLRRAVAPSARARLSAALSALEAFCGGRLGVRALQQARSDCFAALPEFERTTLEALRASVGPSAPANTPLEQHAEHVVWRYARLATRLAADGVLLSLDGATEPPLLASVIQQVAASRAYQGAGLGAARQRELCARALEQAAFESEKLGGGEHPQALLGVQILHEYLGVRWKVLHDAERAYIDAFVNWALGGS